MKQIHVVLCRLFESVFWPAAAGNVFWSFCSLLIKEGPEHSSPVSGPVRLLVLALLAFYLSLEWVRNYRNLPKTVTWKFWVADWLHVCAVVFIALTSYERPDLLERALVFYFVVTGAGHALGAWKNVEREGRYAHRWLAAINLSGLVVLAAGHLPEKTEPWALAASLAVVLTAWLTNRRQDIVALFRAPGPQPGPQG